MYRYNTKGNTYVSYMDKGRINRMNEDRISLIYDKLTELSSDRSNSKTPFQKRSYILREYPKRTKYVRKVIKWSYTEIKSEY